MALTRTARVDDRQEAWRIERPDDAGGAPASPAEEPWPELGRASVASRFDPAYPLDHARDRAAVRQAGAVPRDAVAASLRLLADRPAIHDRLQEIRVPVAVVVGEHDRVFPPSHSRKLDGCGPGAAHGAG